MAPNDTSSQAQPDLLVWLLPIYIIAELFFKGGSASAKLMDEVDTAKSAMTLSAASKIVRWMGRWLRYQAEYCTGGSDQEQHTIADQVYGGLLMLGDVPWYSSYGHLEDDPIKRQRMVYSSVAGTFEDCASALKDGVFDEKWKCPPELSKAMDDMPYPERETPKRQKASISMSDIG